MTRTNNQLSMIRAIHFLKVTAISTGLIFTSSVYALRFEPADQLTIDLDTTLAYGAMWRLEKQKGFGVPRGLESWAGPGDINFQNKGVLKWNSDDGDRNFDQGDMVSDRYAVTSDMDLHFDKYGVFLRAQIFYDAVYFEETAWDPGGWENWLGGADIDCNADGVPDGIVSLGGCAGPTRYNGIGTYAGPESINNVVASGDVSDPSHFSQQVKDQHGYDATFLDSYIYGTFDLGGHTLDLRLGRQAINWGEALMLQGGIGFAMNRIDAAAATSPGVELKEIFLPSDVLYGQLDLTESVTLEAYWQYTWQPSKLFATGSYWEGTDMLASDVLLVNTEYGGNCMFGRDKTYTGADPNGVGGSHACDAQWVENIPGVPGFEHYLQTNSNAMFRTDDKTPDNPRDQFGVAVRVLLDGGSEAGVYFVQYHDKYPSVWAANKGAIDYATFGTNATYNPDYTGPTMNSVDTMGFNSNRYTIEYKERLRLWGLTYNTVVNDVQMGFELVYHENQPLVPACSIDQILAGTFDMSLPINDANGNTTPNDERFKVGESFRSDCKDPSAKHYAAMGGVTYTPGNYVWNSDVVNRLLGWPVQAEVFTYNMGVTLVVPPTPFWDTGIFVGELGGWYVGSGFENEDLKVTPIGAFTQRGNGISGIFLPQYKNVAEGVDLTIPMFINYTIDGSFSYYNYNEHAVWFSIGLEAVYLSNTRLGIVYSTFGGRNSMWRDRDNIAVTAKYTF